MKCLTICQPYADLILLPDSDPRNKRTENRTWVSGYRGPLLIHAGKSKSWIEDRGDGIDLYDFKIDAFVFGAIIGIVRVIDWCSPAHVRSRYPALKDHQHIEGPQCMVIADPRRFETPVAWRGEQGLFNVAPEAVALQLARLK